jgi:spermidine/putrescine transport system permease protein
MALFPPKHPIAPLEYTRKLWMRGWVGGDAAVPLCAAARADGVQLQRQQTQRRLARLHAKYYEKALNNDSLVEAMVNSLTIAFWRPSSALSSRRWPRCMLWRFRFPLQGRGRRRDVAADHRPRNLHGRCDADLLRQDRLADRAALAAQPGGNHHRPHHLLLPVRSDGRAQPDGQFNREQEEAAKDLGRERVGDIPRRILLPHMKPGLIAGALLAFTLSLDDFVITFFTSGPDTVTFPVKVYSMVRFSVTPEVNAASTILILLTIALTAVALKVQGVKGIAETPLNDRQNRRSSRSAMSPSALARCRSRQCQP